MAQWVCRPTVRYHRVVHWTTNSIALDCTALNVALLYCKAFSLPPHLSSLLKRLSRTGVSVTISAQSGRPCAMNGNPPQGDKAMGRLWCHTVPCYVTQCRIVPECGVQCQTVSHRVGNVLIFTRAHPCTEGPLHCTVPNRTALHYTVTALLSAVLHCTWLCSTYLP